MAIAAKQIPSQVLTYEDYMAEGEINQRYDIIDGVRIFMPGPIRDHQDISFNIGTLLKRYGQESGSGKMYMAACDVLITRQPLRTRQPDVLFISYERLKLCAPSNDPTPLLIGPELAVEVLSPSETRKMREAKIADYQKVGVLECWVVDVPTQTVEVLRLTPQSVDSVAIYGNEEMLQSLTFPDLTVAVADFFKI